MSADQGNLGEFDLINRYFQQPDRHSAQPGVILGIGDDAALLQVPSGADLVASVDTLVEGRHFLAKTDARSVGHRALAVNLSDMAAMGATPAWATLALTLPHADPQWLEQFSAGLLNLAAAHAVTLVGGDTTRGPLTVSVQILGHLPHGTALRRRGAHPGDLLVVTGTLGDAGAGLKFATCAPSGCDLAAVDELISRYDYPTPRVAFGLAARGIAHAAMDLSDGLVGDLPKLAHASGLAARVDIERLPISSALRAVASTEQARDWALAAGDDYELLLAVPPDRVAALAAAAGRLHLTLTTIGDLCAGNGVTWSLNGREFSPNTAGWDHFSRASTQITV